MAPNPRRVDARLEALYEKVPATGCSGVCHGACCFIEDAVSARERERVERASGKKLETIDHGLPGGPGAWDHDPFGNPLARWRCSMLTSDGRCSVYDDRPMIGRTDHIPTIVETALGRDYTHTLMAEGHDASEDGTGRGTPLVVVDEVMAIGENQRGEILEVPYARTLVTGGGKPGQGYPLVRIGERVRRLTPTECERLQGFPDGWALPDGPSLAGAPSWYELPPEERPRVPVNPRPHSKRYEAMGRAVTVPVAEAIGRRLSAA